MFVGDSLTNIRLLRGLSRKQLAEELDLTEQSIWQYENGYISPSLQVINKMRTYFNVQPKYFYSNLNLSNEINEQQIAYRSTVRNSRQKTKSETVYLEFLNYVTNYLSSIITFPPNQIKAIKDYAVNYKSKNAGYLEMDEIIEHIASYARNSIGLSDQHNEDLLFLIEKSGAFI